MNLKKIFAGMFGSNDPNIVRQNMGNDICRRNQCLQKWHFMSL